MPDLLSLLGLRSEIRSPADRQRLNTNIVALSISVLLFGMIGLFLGYQYFFLVKLLVPFALAFAAIFTLGLSGNTSLARIGLVIGWNLMLFAFAGTFGQRSNIQLLYMVSLLLPFTLFEINQKQLITIGLMLPILLFFAVERGMAKFLGSTNIEYYVAEPISRAVALLTFLMTSNFLYVLVSSSHKMAMKNMALLTAFPDQILRVGASTHVISDVLGKNTFPLRTEDPEGHSLEEALPEELYPRIKNHLQKNKDRRGVSHLEYIHHNQADHIQHFDIRFSQGQEQDLLLIIRDVTEIKEYEALISAQQQTIAQDKRLAAMGQMAAGIAHEVNNPLMVITGNAETIKDYVLQEPINREKILTRLDKIAATCNRISKIVKGLQAFSRDTSKEPVTRVALKSIMDDTLEFCQTRIKNHGMELRVPTVDSALMIECRPIQVSQVLINLINNAHDAIEKLPDPWIQVDVKDLGERVSIWITDSGNGIPKEIRDKILDPFFTTKPVGKGTGLGLSISSGIIQDHGGKLWIDHDCPNTRFVIELPKVAPQQEKGSAA